MTVDVYEGTEWAKTYDGFLDSSMATLAGAAYGVSPSKSVRFNRRTDNDVEHERVILHYTARVREQSNLENRTDYNDAVAANVIPAETKGIWYDLLPPGIYPDMSSIKLRGGDRITGAYTIPNYENTDRILLVVECELTPRPSTYSGRWYDEPTLTFDAIYPWENVHQYGQTGITNYVAFESLTENLRHDTLGTISGQKGEPDKPEQDPSKKNNGNTPSMPAAIAAALTDLDPNTDDNRFLYARADVNLTLNLKALTGLSKAVKDDLVGVWTQGLDDQEQVNVYEGHDYTYRLRVVSGPNTVTKDIVLYDTVENYRIPDPNDSVVHDATKAADYADVESKKNWYGDWQESDEYPGGQWRGTLKSIDLSEFVQGYHVDVKLWVSEIPNLQFADAPEDANNEVKREIFASGAYNIDDEDERALSGWVQVTPDENGVWTVPADMNVSAIAIDARLMEDGSEFELDELQAVTAYLHMTAPDDGDTQEEVDSNYHAKGAYAHVADSADTENCTIDWEAARDPKNNMHAYNNARMKAKAYVKGNPDSSSDQMIRNDYTRVGIMPRIITVKKAWNDDDDYDALRTQSVTVHLMRKQFGDADWTDMQRSAVLSADNDWQAVFQQVDIVDALNRPYQYSFVEDEVPGYTYQVTKDNDGAYLLTNTHEKDTVSISGQKVWTGDEDQTELRPASIKVSLYRDGVYQRAITVRPNAEGEWNYSFGNLLKNKRGGEPYVYTVEEEYVPKYISEYEGYEVINNTLRPFGDLTVEKIIANATEAAKDREFTFTFTAFEELTQAYIDQLRQEHEESGSAEPFTAPTTGSMLLDAYAYVITEDDTEVETGTIKSGDEFTLKGGQKIRIIDLPSEATYTIEETAAAGYTLTGTVGDTGTIRAGRTQEAEFTNTYHSAGAVQLSASKRLTGHRLNRGQFRFDLVDMTEGSDTYEQVIRMGSNEAPSSTTQDEDGVVTSLADVFFGQIRYTEADDGKTFTYVIKEQDTGKSGYTYDADQKTVTVTVADNGNGTMTVTATPSSAAELIFDNTYQAEGEISFKAWKVLEVYDLEKDQFEFELYKYDPTAGDKVGEPLQTAKNNEDGTINFTPIKFTQNDVNVDPNNPNVYWYLLREKKGNDPAVVYSNIEYVIKVTPYDNNDGTISFAQDDQQVKRIYNEVNCQTCDGVGYLTSSGAPAVYGATSDGKGQEVWLWDVHKSSNSGINASTRKAVIYVPDAALCETCHGACYSSAGVSCEACKGTGLRVGVDLDITSQNVAGCFEDSFVFDGLRTTDIYRHYDAMGFDSVDEFCMRVGRVVDGTLIESENGNDSRAFRAYIPKSDIGKRAPITGGTHACETCGGTGKVLVEGRIESTGETTGPVFVNGYRDGNLKLTKNINNGNPSQKFKFKVKLVGLGTGNFSLERKGDGDNSGAHEDGGESGGEATHDISGILPVYHADNSLINGTVAYAALKKSTGELIFFRTDANDPMDPWGNPIGASGFNSNRKESADGEYVWYNRVDNGSYPWPWTNNSTDRLKIQTVTMRDPVRPGSLTYFFQNCTNIVSLDLSKMDIPAGRSVAMWGICDGLSNLKEANFGMMNLSLTSDVQYMFRYCTSLETVNIGHLVRSGYATNRSNYQDNAFTGTKVTRITIGNGTYFSGTITGAYPKPPAGYTDLWTNVEHPEIQLKSVDLFTSPGHGGTWELDPKYYNITFDANGGSGSMQNQRVNTHRDFTTGYSFYRFGYDFTGFEDNYGHFYAVDENGKIKIPSNTYSNASNTEDVQITLTAQWDPVDNTAVMENDTLTITMYGGESVTIFNIPAGTAYEIWEEVPDGWILVSKVNDSGVIVPLETAQSVFTDEYAPDKATSSMTASKLMDGKLTGGYTIGLYKVNNDNTETLIDTKVSSAGGIASFDIITYTLADVGTHEYVIREIVENPDPTIQYDTHDERVRVVVYDDGRGNLYATTGYLDGNAVFVNSTKPGNLELSKTLEKASPKAAEQTFTYTISFLNAQEQPIKLQ